MTTRPRQDAAFPPLDDDGARSADSELEAVLRDSHARKAPSSTAKSRVASFRLDTAAYELLHQKAAEAGMSPRAWLQQAILENRTEIIATARPHPELRPLRFIAGKAGNNLNQVAHHFNAQRQLGKITASTCEKALEILASLEAQFVEAVAHARPR